MEKFQIRTLRLVTLFIRMQKSEARGRIQRGGGGAGGPELPAP